MKKREKVAQRRVGMNIEDVRRLIRAPPVVKHAIAIASSWKKPRTTVNESPLFINVRGAARYSASDLEEEKNVIYEKLPRQERGNIFERDAQSLNLFWQFTVPGGVFYLKFFCL